MQAADIPFAIYFYNPNIHPTDEYQRRKDEVIKFAERNQIVYIDADYDPSNWFTITAGMADEPEGGARCCQCIQMRLRKAADYANSNGYSILTSSLGISRRKRIELINACGEAAVAHYPNLLYWTHNWRKKGGSMRMMAIAKRENFYRQTYCGCVYSRRDAIKFATLMQATNQ